MRKISKKRRNNLIGVRKGYYKSTGENDLIFLFSKRLKSHFDFSHISIKLIQEDEVYAVFLYTNADAIFDQTAYWQ